MKRRAFFSTIAAALGCGAAAATAKCPISPFPLRAITIGIDASEFTAALERYPVAWVALSFRYLHPPSSPIHCSDVSARGLMDALAKAGINV